MSATRRKPRRGSDDGHSRRRKDKHKNKNRDMKKKKRTSSSGQPDEHIPGKKERPEGGRSKQNMLDEQYEKRMMDGLFHQAELAQGLGIVQNNLYPTAHSVSSSCRRGRAHS